MWVLFWRRNGGNTEVGVGFGWIFVFLAVGVVICAGAGN